MKTDVWFSYVGEALTHMLQETLLYIQILEGTPIACIEERFRQRAKQRVGGASFYIVHGVDAKLLPLAPSVHHAVVQVASQFNFLEPLGQEHMPILHTDLQCFEEMTQGPQAFLASRGALVVRDHAFQG